MNISTKQNLIKTSNGLLFYSGESVCGNCDLQTDVKLINPSSLSSHGNICKTTDPLIKINNENYRKNVLFIYRV